LFTCDAYSGHSTLRPYLQSAICQTARCIARYATFNLQPSIFNLQSSIFNLQSVLYWRVRMRQAVAAWHTGSRIMRSMQIFLTPLPDDPDLVAAIAAAVAALLAEPPPAESLRVAAWRVAAIAAAHGGVAERGVAVRWATAERAKRGRWSQGTPWGVD
jgi:hypothetical protein